MAVSAAVAFEVGNRPVAVPAQHKHGAAEWQRPRGTKGDARSLAQMQARTGHHTEGLARRGCCRRRYGGRGASTAALDRAPVDASRKALWSQIELEVHAVLDGAPVAAPHEHALARFGLDVAHVDKHV